MEKPRYQEAVKPIGSGAPTLYVLFFSYSCPCVSFERDLVVCGTAVYIFILFLLFFFFLYCSNLDIQEIFKWIFTTQNISVSFPGNVFSIMTVVS